MIYTVEMETSADSGALKIVGQVLSTVSATCQALHTWWGHSGHQVLQQWPVTTVSPGESVVLWHECDH